MQSGETFCAFVITLITFHVITFEIESSALSEWISMYNVLPPAPPKRKRMTDSYGHTLAKCRIKYTIITTSLLIRSSDNLNMEGVVPCQNNDESLTELFHQWCTLM